MRPSTPYIKVRDATRAVLVVAGLVSVMMQPGVAGAQGDVDPLEWRVCAAVPEADCARLTVPLDDTDPVNDRTIDLVLSRVRARDRDRRIGSLLVNPGGPGAPGAEFAAQIAGALPDEIQDRFDIVGWDPRGSGRSAGVQCDDELDPLYALDWDPDTVSERASLESATQTFVESCIRRSGDVLPFVTSDRTARDMDRIRAALGDEQLTYLGFSYGSYLGAQYAQQFPERVRALVLDGGIDPGLDGTSTQVEQAVGFERALDLFFRSCARRDRCAFHGGDDPAAAYDALRARLDDHGIPAGDGRRLNGTLFDTGIAQLLYDGSASWSTLADVLAAAERGDGKELVFYADTYTGRDEDGRYDNLQDSFLAITCADGPALGDLASMREIEAAAAVAAPRLGRTIVNNSLACALWPVPGAARAPLRAPDSAPILVVGTKNDPATPLSWAQSLARQLGPATLVTVGGARHTAVAGGNQCVDRIVVRYVVDLEVPRGDSRC
jgi:pimeloyl-ACP methyl ester carboxylesterase